MTETAHQEVDSSQLENLESFKNLSLRYTSVRDQETVDASQLEHMLEHNTKLRYYLTPQDIVDGEGNVGDKLFEKMGESRHLADVLWGIKNDRIKRLEDEPHLLDEFETTENIFSRALTDYQMVRTLRVYIDQNAQMSDRKQEILNELQVAEQVTQLASVHALLNYADRAFMADMVAASDIPFVDRKIVRDWDGLSSEERGAANLILNLQRIAVESNNPAIRSAYTAAVDQLRRDEINVTKILGQKPLGDSEYHAASQQNAHSNFVSRHHRRNAEMMDEDRVPRQLRHEYVYDIRRFVDEFRYIAHYISEGVDGLQAEPRDIQRLFDVIAPHILEDSPKSAIDALAKIRDPRGIALLHEMMTSNRGTGIATSAADSIVEIVRHPLTDESMQAFLDQASDRERFAIKMARRPIVASMANLERNSWQYQRELPEILMGVPVRIENLHLVEIYVDFAKSKGLEIQVEDYIDIIQAVNSFSARDMIKLFSDNLGEVLPLIAKNASEIGFLKWQEDLPTFHKLLVDYDGGKRFPLEILQAHGVGQDTCQKLLKLFDSKDLKEGELARREFLSGLVVVSGHPNFQVAIEKIFEHVNGAKDDAKKVRRIFTMLKNLSDLQRLTASDDLEIVGSTLEEIGNNCQTKLVEVLSEKLDLQGEVSGERWGELLNDGSLALVIDLYSHYVNERVRSSKPEWASAETLVLEIAKHMVIGDFTKWRNESADSKQILTYYLPSSEQQRAWLEPIEAIHKTYKISAEEQIAGVVGEVSRIALEARAHAADILNTNPQDDFFSVENRKTLEARQSSLELQIKGYQQGGEVSLKSLRRTKEMVDDQLRVIRGLDYLINLGTENYGQGELQDVVRKTIATLTRMPNMQQPVLDLQQIEKNVLPTLNKVVSAISLDGQDTTDLMSLLRSGMEPRETCQSARGGSYNYCLPTTVASTDIILLNSKAGTRVENRALAKLKKVTTDEIDEATVILLEPPYGLTESYPGYASTLEVGIKKAEAVGVPLVITQPLDMATGADHTKTISLIAMVAKQMDAQVVIVSKGAIHGKKGIGDYEYSDTLGGTIEDFDEPIEFEDVYMIYPKNVALLGK